MRSVLAVLVLCGCALAAMMGGWSDQDAGKMGEYMHFQWKAAKGLLNSASNDGPNHMIPIKVLKAQTQVVSGMNYHFEVLFGESQCNKGTVAATELDESSCKLKEGGKRAVYTVKIYEQPWTDTLEFTEVKKLRDVAADEQI